MPLIFPSSPSDHGLALMAGAGVALLGIFHDADVRDAVADRIIDVGAFTPSRARS